MLVLLLAALPLMLGEVVLRMWGARISQNIKTISSISDNQQALRSVPFESRVLVLGNSTTLEGVETSVVKSNARISGVEIDIVAMHGAFVAEWEWIFRSRYISHGVSPSKLILNVHPSNLSDGSGRRLERMALASPFSKKSPYLPGNHVIRSREERLQFLVSGASWIINRGPSIGVTILNRSLPFYEEGRAWAGTKSRPSKTSSTIGGVATFVALENILAEAYGNGGTVMIIMMPSSVNYLMPPEVIRLVSRFDVGIVDLSHTVEPNSENFVDDIHLSPIGKMKFTPIYSQALNLATKGKEADSVK